MAHDRDATFDQESDGLGHTATAFELHGTAAGLLHHPRSRHEGLLPRRLVGAERHIDHDQRAPRAAHHRQPLQDHHIERDRHRRLQPMHHHAQRIADQDKVAVPIEQARGMGMIRGETDDGVAALAGTDVGRGQPLDLVLCRHWRNSRTPACRIPRDQPQADGRQGRGSDKARFQRQAQ